jgi:hypothetical protein
VEQATDEKQKRIHAQKGVFLITPPDLCYLENEIYVGLQNLRRYFELMVFQSYLQSTKPDTMSSFESIETFVKNRPGSYFAYGVQKLIVMFVIQSLKHLKRS